MSDHRQEITLEQAVAALADRALSEPAAAVEALTALEAQASRDGAPRASAWAALYLTRALSNSGRLADALAKADLTVERMRALPDPAGEIEAITATAIVWAMLGDAPLARQHFGRAIELAARDGHDRLRGIALAGLAFTWGREGVADRYVAITREAIAVLEGCDEPRRLALAWANVGGGLTRLEHLDDAEDAYSRAIALADAHDDPRVRAIATGGLGEIAAYRGALDDAARLFADARATFDRLGRPYEGLMQAALFARILIDRGQPERASLLCDATLPGAQANRFIALEADLHAYRARARRALGDHDGAFEALEAAVASERALREERQREHDRQLESLREAARAHAAGDRDAAVARLEEDNRRLRDALAREQTGRTELARQAGSDALTGLANRRTLETLGRYELGFAHERGGELAVLALDIDHFKRLNDDLGHAAGDAALVHVARSIVRLLRGRDLTARVGGEEFVVLLPSTDRAGAVTVAERIRETLAAGPFPTPAGAAALTVSLGVACVRPGDTLDALLRRADEGLYAAKRAGRDRVVFVD